MPYKMWFHTKYRSTSIDKVNLRSTVNSGFLTFPTARPLDMSFCVVLGTRNFSGEKKCSDNNWRTLHCRWLNQQYQEEKIYLKLLSKNNLRRQYVIFWALTLCWYSLFICTTEPLFWRTVPPLSFVSGFVPLKIKCLYCD